MAERRRLRPILVAFALLAEAAGGLSAPPAASASPAHKAPAAREPACEVPGYGSRACADTVRLSLVDVVRIAGERNPAVEAEREAALEARARVEGARAGLLPHVSADAQHGARTFNTASFGLEFPVAPGSEPLFDPSGDVRGPVTTVDLRGRLTQTLFDWSTVEGVRAAGTGAEAAATRIEVARERAAAVAATAWLRALRGRERLEARRADVALAEELLEVAQELLISGVGVRLDVTRARAQLAAMQSERLTAESDAARGRLDLLRALSLPLDTELDLADTLVVPAYAATADATNAVAVALSRRADLRELEQRIAAARLDVQAVRSERLPTLSVGASEGVNGSSYGHLLNTYDWSLWISFPVFDGGRRGARTDQELAQVRVLEARRRELEEAIAFAVRDALLQVEAATQFVAASRVRVELAQEELDQARERFAAGVAGSADVSMASLRLSEARAADVDARAAYHAARIALAVAGGSVRELR